MHFYVFGETAIDNDQALVGLMHRHSYSLLAVSDRRSRWETWDYSSAFGKFNALQFIAWQETNLFLFSFFWGKNFLIHAIAVLYIEGV